jgi:HK97 family phage major capsid protein/HK97 family phage prohead protease
MDELQEKTETPNDERAMHDLTEEQVAAIGETIAEVVAEHMAEIVEDTVETLSGEDPEAEADAQEMAEKTAPMLSAPVDEYRAQPGELKVGDFVSWNSSGGRARGQIEHIMREGTLGVPDSEFSIEASEEDPAALIRIFREGAEGWAATETMVGHRFSTLAKIEALRSMEGKYQRTETTAFAEVEDRTFEFPFSSEYPVARYFGNEVLSHEMDAADLSRLNDGAPLLFNHNPDRVVGVVERAWIDGKKKRGYVKVRFSRNSFAKEVMADVKDGVLRGVSFGYSINKMEERGDNFVATEWSPYEVSVCSIAADPSIGIGRSLAIDSAATAASPTPEPKVPEMENTTPDVEVIRSKAVEAERSRIATITALGEKHGLRDLARELIDGGRTVDEARAAVLEKMETRASKVEHRIADEKASEIGLSDKEARSFSFLRALNYLANPGDKEVAKAAAFEREVSEAASKAYGKPANGIMVPTDVLRRDLATSPASAGGNLVATDLLAASFIELLRNKLALANVGATVLNGLQGNIAIPKQTGAATAYWVGEGNSPTESQEVLGQVTMSPKTVGAFVDYSRRLLLQSSIDVEQMVRNDLARVIALEIDRAGIYGSGNSNQPLGLINTVGINTKALTGYGTFAELIDMETEVAKDNADAGSLFYLMNAAARGALKSTPKSTSAVAAGFVYENDQVNGYGAVVSNQLALDDILFGAFDQMIMGMWSGLDLTLDPYAGATSGTVRIIALQDVDFAVKQPGAFCYGTGALS